MRLAVLFLTVLALAAILTSMAAWGISYGTSYEQVSTMASQFTSISQASIEEFISFVSRLLRSNVALVDALLDAQEAAGTNRTEQTKAQVARSIGALVNYTTNSTEQTQQQMEDVVDTFGHLMDNIMTGFRELASGYMVQVRLGSAAQGLVSTSSLVTDLTTTMQSVQQLIDLNVLDLSLAPTDPISAADCTVLAAVCSSSTAFFGVSVSVASATGRYYSCSAQDGALVSVRTASGGVYNESFWRWRRSSPTATSASMRQRCLTETPVAQTVGVGCSTANSCQCGADPRCTPWYQPLVNATASYFLSNMYTDAAVGTAVHTTLTLVNTSTTPPTLLGVVYMPIPLHVTQHLVPTVQGLAGQAYTALFLNDTTLSAYGSNVRKCAPNTPQPGDPSLPYYSALRSCDPGLRAVAQWVAANRSLAQTVTLNIDGVLWDVTPLKTAIATYFFAVGTNQSNAAIDAASALAARNLAATRAHLLSEVAANSAATKAYMAAVGAQNIHETQAMQKSFLLGIRSLENSSQAMLQTSQAGAIVSALALQRAQTTAVDAQRTSTLVAMGVTAGWTAAVVVGLLLGVLLASAWGTIHVTKHLTEIIGLMEDVADMKVENLTIPQGSSVQEVGRIQTAFQVMVSRLAEYKSYIPAGVFERLAREGTGADAGLEEGHVSDRSETNHIVTGRQSRTSQDCSAVSRISSNSVVHVNPAPVTSTRRSATRQVAVLSVNVVGFMDLLLTSNEALSKTVFNEYITVVHEVISQSRGNIDFLSGDQVFVTFNAHLPCGDPAGAATTAALEVRQLLVSRVGDRLKFRIGLSFGSVFSGTVGYAKFKFMVTVGSPMKMAAVLSRMDRLENGAILVDTNLQERMKYLYNFRSVELLHLSWMNSFGLEGRASQHIFMLVSKKKLNEDEWLYQGAEGKDSSDWNKVFEQLVAASSTQEMQRLLEGYLSTDPIDDLALRLRDRLALWVPGKGIAV